MLLAHGKETNEWTNGVLTIADLEIVQHQPVNVTPELLNNDNIFI